MWLSIAAWVFFAVMAARHLKNKAAKILMVAVILTFAFLPPIAEWDSVLMSESGSYSLFIVMLGISLEIIKRILKEGRRASPLTYVFWAAWFVFFVLWAFMRDTNANIMLFVVIFFIALMLIPAFRKRIPIRLIAATTAVLLVLFVLYAAAASESGRWMGSWDGLYNGYIAIYRTHNQFFIDHGMPTGDYQETRSWAAQNGARTYLLMLLNYPRFAINTFLVLMQDVFAENIQPFFFTVPTSGYRNMVALGNIFHPLSSAAFLVSLLTGILVAAVSFRRRNTGRKIWGWMAVWMLLLVFCYYGLAFFADAAGIIRHCQGATMPMRLMTWLFPIVLADYSLGDWNR